MEESMTVHKHQDGKHKHQAEKHERQSERDREGSGDDPRTHANTIRRRWLGSAPPTPERFANALRQWRALSGAVVRTPTDVTAAGKKPKTASASPASGASAEEEMEP
jgi:hypothetical protein